MEYTLLPPEADTPPEPQRDTTESFLRSVDQKIEQHLSPFSSHTVVGYKNDLHTFFSFIAKDLRAVDEYDIFDYLKKLEEVGYRPATINRKLYSLTKIFDLYISLDLVRYNPVKKASSTTKLNKTEDRKIHISIIYEDVKKVIESARPKTAIIVKTLANTGLRVSEMIGIRKDHIKPYDTSYMQVKIIGKGKKERYIYLSYELYEEIKNLFDSESIYLFASRNGNQLSRINLYTQVRRAFKRHTGKDCSPHQLRHFFSTYKIGKEKQDVKSVSQYLGHSRISITLDMYTHTTLDADESHIF